MDDTIRRVAFVSPSWPPGSQANGINSYVQYLRSGLAEQGVESKVATYSRSPGGESAHLICGELSQGNAASRLATKIGWRWFPRKSARLIPTLEAMLSLRRLEREWPFDILETEESFGIARWIALAVAAPVVVRLHGPWCVVGPARGEPQDAAFLKRVDAEGRAIAKAAAVSSPSRDVLERVRGHYGQPLPNAVVIPNPGPEPNENEMWDGSRASPGLVLFVGRFDRNKGGDIAVNAFAQLADRLPSLRLAMAGPDDGIVDERGRRWSFPEYVTARVPAQHRGRIEFIGHVHQEALAAWRRRASVVISASRYENFAMTVLEALAQGCPLVCPDAGGLPEMVKHGETGLIYPTGDAAALARCIESLILAPGRAAELGRQGHLNYCVRFLPKQVAKEMADFYKEVCDRTRSSSTRTRLRRAPLV